MEFSEILLIVGICAVALILISLIISLVCFFMIFYSPKRKPTDPDVYDIPPGRAYEAHRDEITAWMRAVRNMPCENFTITSHDGLKLTARYYEYKKGAPIEILFHGYRGNAERDLSGGVFRCFSMDRNAILVDQRASGTSEGHVISFGINEEKDCRRWIDFAIEHFGKNVELIITGVSMGAATVAMAAGNDLPSNVKMALADCGYTSAKEIIFKVVRDMKLPARLLYPFIKLGAFLFGGFNIDANSPIEAVKRAKTPIIFIHGDSDGFVPHEMSVKLSEVCASRCKMVTIPGAEHGLAYPIDKESYVKELKDFYRILR